MARDIKDRVASDLELDASAVWVLSGHKEFQYSEGASPERYLRRVLSSAEDLTSNSYELEQWIRDWPSEYHLSRKRSQLLRGFQFDRSKSVLEVGCGCGAITRFLGETFDDVVAIEGSLPRARLARLRTRGMDNVSIICAPFQDVKATQQFDIIFCIGVFEYSRMFVDDPDPFNFVLEYFHNLLKPDGEVVIAIENQFGLKYFSSSKEDHTEVVFDGLEGYPRHGKKERTFGYFELRDMLGRHFPRMEFYFPYPDYKTPSCILSEEFLSKAKPAELVGRAQSNSLMERPTPLFDERLVLFELERNRMLPFFANSFLVVAGKQAVSSRLASLGLFYSDRRMRAYQTVTVFSEGDDGRISVTKTAPDARGVTEQGVVAFHEQHSEWVDGLSIYAQAMQRIRERDLTLKEIFAVCGIWAQALRALAHDRGGIAFLDGKYVDCMWANTFVVDGECRFIDLEWEWRSPIRLNVLVIRTIFYFLMDIASVKDLSPRLAHGSPRNLIRRIAGDLGFALTKADFDEFCRLESALCQVVYGQRSIRTELVINLLLWNRTAYALATSMSQAVRTCRRYLRAAVERIRQAGAALPSHR